jgi:predicted peptidase
MNIKSFKISLLLLTCFILICGFAIAQHKKEKILYPYLTYLPKKYSAENNQPYPVLIYLHGGSLRGKDLSKLKTYGPPKEIAKGREFDLIIISPQCPENKYWSSDNWFEPLYANIIKEYNIDTNRVYLSGISIGGYGTWITAMDYPDKFAAIAPLCGGCNDSDTVKISNLKSIPILTYHGTADDMIPINETQRIVDKLKPVNKQLKFVKMEGEGHGIQYLYQDTVIYNWLLQYSK